MLLRMPSLPWAARQMGHSAEKCWRDKPCSYCGKPGHDGSRCFKKRREQQSGEAMPIALVL